MNIMSKVVVFSMLFGLSHTIIAASASSSGVGTGFSVNSTRISATLGSGNAFNDDYIILGVGAGYFVLNGLELGIDAQHWFSGDPSITKVSPRMTYVFTQLETIKPYLGVFYRRTFYGDYNARSLNDENSYGYRVGAYFNANKRIYIGGGLVYEKYTDCNSLNDCTSTYPEITVAISF